jgi:predicted metal-dependent phosphoesterase TrpH
MTSSSALVPLDLHVHTGRYSQCAELVDPFQIGDAALRAGLGGVVLTEHDVLWQDEEIELLRAATSPVRIYRGLEVSAAGCHVLVIGIEDAAMFERGMPAGEVIRVAHAAGAVAVLAHPYRDTTPKGLPIEDFDAIEIGSTSFDRPAARRSMQLARKFAKPMVASSDAHALSRIGWGWTEFPVLPANELELAVAIRNGAGQAVLPRALQARKPGAR